MTSGSHAQRDAEVTRSVRTGLGGFAIGGADRADEFGSELTEKSGSNLNQ